MKILLFTLSIFLSSDIWALSQKDLEHCGQLGVIVKGGAALGSNRTKQCSLSSDVLEKGNFITVAGMLQSKYTSDGYKVLLNGNRLDSNIDMVQYAYFYPSNGLVKYILFRGVSKRADCDVTYLLFDFSQPKPLENFYELDDACFDSEDALSKVDFSNGNVMIDFISSISSSDSQRQPRVTYSYINGKLDVFIKKGKKTLKHYTRTTRYSL